MSKVESLRETTKYFGWNYSCLPKFNLLKTKNIVIYKQLKFPIHFKVQGLFIACVFLELLHHRSFICRCSWLPVGFIYGSVDNLCFCKLTVKSRKMTDSLFDSWVDLILEWYLLRFSRKYLRFLHRLSK